MLQDFAILCATGYKKSTDLVTQNAAVKGKTKLQRAAHYWRLINPGTSCVVQSYPKSSLFQQPSTAEILLWPPTADPSFGSHQFSKATTHSNTDIFHPNISHLIFQQRKAEYGQNIISF